MRKTIATALLIVGTTGAAMAADLPSRTAPVYAPPLPPVFTWSGGYIGINAGYAFDYSSRFNTTNGLGGVGAQGVPTSRPATVRVNSDGFTAGGQIGYNYQFGAGNGILVGFEADAAYTDLGQTNNYLAANGNGDVSRFHTSMDFLGTVRGRVGYAFDRVLVFGTGGFAYGDVETRARFFGANGLTNYIGGRSDLQTGYTYGGGIEYAVPTGSFLQTLNFFHSSAVTIKAEYLHYDLGSQRYAVAATGLNGSSNAYSQREKTDGNLARIGLNYKF